MELEIIRFIQSFSSTMNDRIFEVITMLGEEFFVVAICTWIYWCYDKAKGKYIAYSLFTAITVNNIVKDIFKLPRPIGQAGILSKRVETATGYSFPSGHTQTASTLWTSISILSGKVWVYVISILAVVLVAISRLYLGVHYPKDVLVGAILGIIIPFVSCYLFEKFRNELMIATITLIPLSLGLFFAESADFY
ncbi:MAG: phosphatase PAP2 family protein, partial [Oscillospiraceae bacterium]